MIANSSLYSIHIFLILSALGCTDKDPETAKQAAAKAMIRKIGLLKPSKLNLMLKDEIIKKANANHL